MIQTILFFFFPLYFWCGLPVVLLFSFHRMIGLWYALREMYAEPHAGPALHLCGTNVGQSDVGEVVACEHVCVCN